MKAYKIWNDTKHFIHKDTTNELNVVWTENINDALDSDDLFKDKQWPSYTKAVKFFFDELGFSFNPLKYDALNLI